MPDFYYTTSTTDDRAVLGVPNEMAASGNPLKGLVTSPRWSKKERDPGFQDSLEFYYLGLDEVLVGEDVYDWRALEETLQHAESRGKHVIWRLFCQWPNKGLRLPQFLIDAVELREFPDGQPTPYYNDPILLEALRKLVFAWAAKYDGDKRVAFIQVGLLGKFGEFHTHPMKNLISDETKRTVTKWFAEAFHTTKVQVRDPNSAVVDPSMGIHDDSFAYTTLDGEENGGETTKWFFWPKVVAAGEADFWKVAVMGGECRPELQDEVFDPEYCGGTVKKQDYTHCIEKTHATYMIHAKLWKHICCGAKLENARRAHAHFGYNFCVKQVAVASSGEGTVQIAVTVEQIGVAPFYYPLRLALTFSNGESKQLDGVHELIDKGDSKTFFFDDVPANADSLNNVKVTLESDYVYESRPIKFAQGEDGQVMLNLPLPD